MTSSCGASLYRRRMRHWLLHTSKAKGSTPRYSMGKSEFLRDEWLRCMYQDSDWSSCASTTDVVSTQTSVLHTERRQSECTYRLELQIALVSCLAPHSTHMPVLQTKIPTADLTDMLMMMPVMFSRKVEESYASHVFQKSRGKLCQSCFPEK